MEPLATQEDINELSNKAYRTPQRTSKSKSLIILTTFFGILSIASITFCVFVAMQTYEKSTKISELETKISNLETKIDGLTQQSNTNPGTSAESDLTYTIIGEYENGTPDQQKGYYVQELPNGGARVTVAMGEQNSGGHSILINKVDTSNGEAKIYVEEISPSEEDTVTMALTYPTAVVEFNRLPDNITVESVDGSTTYLDMTNQEAQE